MNFTDVDDRTIAGAQKAGRAAARVHRPYIAAFLEDAAPLGLEPVEERPRATDEANLRAMADLVGALERHGHTYRSDGSIYFKIATLPAYGELARLDHEGHQARARASTPTTTRRRTRATSCCGRRRSRASRRGTSALGPGRPGWHIECSAMALRLLGEPPIDIHGGGVDLIFPHHENEIAQSEGATGKPFARFWVHVEHLLIDEEKMSKSLGNQFTLPEIVERGFRPSALRYLLLSTHYRKQLKFTWDSLAAGGGGAPARHGLPRPRLDTCGAGGAPGDRRSVSARRGRRSARCSRRT